MIKKVGCKKLEYEYESAANLYYQSLHKILLFSVSQTAKQQNNLKNS